MLWDHLKTLIMMRLTLRPPCMCAGCQRGRRAAAVGDDATIGPSSGRSLSESAPNFEAAYSFLSSSLGWTCCCCWAGGIGPPTSVPFSCCSAK
jgi:hypothetical protein